jgi:hypothetical protein
LSSFLSIATYPYPMLGLIIGSYTDLITASTILIQVTKQASDYLGCDTTETIVIPCACGCTSSPVFMLT